MKRGKWRGEERVDGADRVAKEGNREAGGKEEEKEGMQEGGTREMLFPDASKAKKQKKINKSKISSQTGRETYPWNPHTLQQ